MSGHGVFNYVNNVNAPPPAYGYATIGGTYPPPPPPRIEPTIIFSNVAPYYGNEDMSRLAADLINSHFPPRRDLDGRLLPTVSSSGYTFPRLDIFIAHVLRHSYQPTCSWAFFTALLYITRLKRRVLEEHVNPLQPQGHYLFITAYTLAYGVHFDETPATRSWLPVCQHLLTFEELNTLRRRFCRDIEWRLNATPERLAEFQAETIRTYEQEEQRRRRAG